MENTYIHNLEAAYENLTDKLTTLEIEKEKTLQYLSNKQEYLTDVIYYLAEKLGEKDKWQALQDISKLDKKKIIHENERADLISKMVVQKFNIQELAKSA
jgi:hypothetical protein